MSRGCLLLDGFELLLLQEGATVGHDLPCRLVKAVWELHMHTAIQPPALVPSFTVRGAITYGTGVLLYGTGVLLCSTEGGGVWYGVLLRY